MLLGASLSKQPIGKASKIYANPTPQTPFAGLEEQMTPDQNDYFDLLCDLIEKYDRESLPPLKVSAVALLRHFGLRADAFIS